MRSSPLHAVVRHLRRLAQPGSGGPSSDADLLTRFVELHDDRAFAEIVRRHGPLVWALCRSRLSAADADDAFQATFLVLTRQARTIRKRTSLACWLSGVARRVVQRARTQDSRRREVESRVEIRGSTDDTDTVEQQEWREALNEELHRLPEKYRLPLLLCYYQGLTNEEAALRLGWPHGTVCGRLSRARDLLRQRLTRRGVTLTVAALSAGTADPPSELLAATLTKCVTAAQAGAAGAALSGSVLQLAEGTMYAMWLGKVKVLAFGVLVVAAFGGGAAGWVLVPTTGPGGTSAPELPSDVASPQVVARPEQPNPPIFAGATQANDFDFLHSLLKWLNSLPPDNPLRQALKDLEAAPQQLEFVKPATSDSELQKLRKERYNCAVIDAKVLFERFVAGMEIPDVYLMVCSRITESELALTDRLEDHVAIYKRGIAVANVSELLTKQKYEAGVRGATLADLQRVRYAHLDLRIKLLETMDRLKKRDGR